MSFGDPHYPLTVRNRVHNRDAELVNRSIKRLTPPTVGCIILGPTSSQISVYLFQTYLKWTEALRPDYGRGLGGGKTGNQLNTLGTLGWILAEIRISIRANQLSTFGKVEAWAEQL